MHGRLLRNQELLNDNNFANPLSRKDNRLSQPWAAPDFSKALAQVERLLPAYRGRAVLTRYVPPNALTGA